MAAMTVREVLYMYSVARQAYDRFLSVCGSPEKAQNAVALLVWLDQGTISAIHHVPAMAPDAVAIVAEEANAVLECLRQQEPVLPPIPLISALCMQGGVRIEPGFFAFHKDLVVRGVAHFLDGTGKFVFDDRLHALLRRSETGLIVNPPELMAPYTSQPVAVPEDCRSMFITFSKGNALHREEIFEYFREKWGNCVVRVLMEKTKGGHMPMYGRIIFKTEAIVKLVLNGERLVKISIGQREIWLRKYVPRPTNAAA
ncbi:unnamed protein product [Triticum turgidum subsp. durum]|uniref:RRM domain-containing protein n=1 Tax=Triticum turgidum subsp. durum TaxID=4567 RepID=A0A9R0RYL2_TRITD|nr:unnamed protein product [Triticum turgidum subsp. durum]